MRASINIIRPFFVSYISAAIRPLTRDNDLEDMLPEPEILKNSFLPGTEQVGPPIDLAECKQTKRKRASAMDALSY